jgi:hypothetical protein
MLQGRASEAFTAPRALTNNEHGRFRMAKSSIPLTQERLKQLLDYNPETGVFTWKHRSTGRVQWNTRYAGKRAGWDRGHGYVAIAIDGAYYTGHRLAWLYVYGFWPTNQIDHINCARGDNRITNLREATNAQNKANARLRTTNKSGFKGVSWCKQQQKWVAHIMVNYRSKYLGSADTASAAHVLYAHAANKHFGEFARTE